MREITVTIFENFNNAVEQIPLEEMLNRIQSGIYAHQIKPIRRLLSEGNLKAYDRAKRLLRAFTPSAQFVSGRKMQYMVKYNPVIVLDIDKLSVEELMRVKRMIVLCQYTLSCFVSPSGNGLKVLVCVSTGVEEHRNAFLSVQQYYTALTGVAIDPSGKDITRLCFVSYDPELYYNPEAIIFTPLQGVGQTWPVAGPDKPVLKEGQLLPDGGGQEGLPQGLPLQTEQTGTTKDLVGEIPTWATRQPASTKGSSGINDTYSRCIAYVERHCSFVEGHRNDFVFALALQLRRAGQPEGETLMLLLQDYNFDEKEVRSCVRSAYRYIWQDDPVVTKPSVGATLVVTQGNDTEKQYPEDGQPHGRLQGPEEGRPQGLPLHDEEFSAGKAEPVDSPANPAKKEKKTVRKQFNLKKTEELLSLWYETRYNEVTGIVEWCHAKTKELFRRLEDHHENSMLRRLHHADQPIPITLLHSLINSDYSPSFNPFTDYFKNLPPWDGVTDYMALSMLGNEKEACENFDKAIALDPRSAWAYFCRGKVKNEQKDYRGAILDFNNAFRYDQKITDVFYYRGLAKMGILDFRGAAEDLTAALEIDPKNSEARYNLGISKQELYDLQGAVAEYHKVIALSPDNAKAHHNRGVCREQLGDYQGALDDFARVIEVDPRYAEAYLSRGYLKLETGDLISGTLDLKKAAELGMKEANEILEDVKDEYW